MSGGATSNRNGVIWSGQNQNELNIMFVGEAWGQEEAIKKRPFVGPSGGILTGMLKQSGIDRNKHLLTNVFNFQPKPSNAIANVCGPKSEGIKGLPRLLPSKYVRAEFKPEIERLHDEVIAYNPNVVVALGATAAWAFLGTSGIKSIRGAPVMGYAHDTPIKILPTYHPAAVMRDWTLRPIVLADLDKAKREAMYPEIRRPRREILIEPTITDLWHFYRFYIAPSPELSIDIETIQDQITCIGFAPSIDRALVVPFYDPSQEDGNYWHDIKNEKAAWLFVRNMCHLEKAIVGQNFMYDMHFLWRSYGITVPYHEDDTMLLHHALQPEMVKSLGFLGSVYTDEASWKFMRTKGTVKLGDV